MKRIMLVLLTLIAFVASNCSKVSNEPGKKQGVKLTKAFSGDYTTGNLTYTSMSKVYSLGYTISSITPAIDNNKIPYGTASDYLTDASCLGYFGPLGPYGPLGLLGPIGDNSWNASYWITGNGDWSDWSDAQYGGMSSEGPLGHNGPVAGDQYYGITDPGLTLFQTNDFAVHSRAMGVWTPLGPIGPLGALGPLGPLGPIGAHGYTANSNGEYTDNSQVKRTYDVDFDGNGNMRTYELYEKYPESFAEAKTDNDTSFMVEGTSSSFEDVDVYSFTSSVDQFVTIVVVPEAQLDDFDFSIVDANDNYIATSSAGTYIDWIQVKVPAGTTLKARVKCFYSGHTLASTYRLYVTGSTQYLNESEIAGDHISVWQ